MSHPLSLRHHLAAVLLAASVIPASALDLYVSIDGDNSQKGTVDSPLRDLAGARDRIRSLDPRPEGDIRIHFSSGLYEFQSSVVFESQDSGSEGQQIIYQAAAEAEVIFDGGSAVTGWELIDDARGIHRARVPSGDFRQVYINGERAVRARIPNRESDETFEPYLRMSDQKVRYGLITKDDWSLVKDLPDLEDIELVMASHWYHQRIRIGGHALEGEFVKIDPVNPEGKFNKPRHFYVNSPFYFENSLVFLDQPGEWFFDRETRELFVIPKSKQDLTSGKVRVPRLNSLILLSGTSEEPIKNITFRGIVFQNTNWTAPSDHGLNVTQFAQPHGVERTWENPLYPPAVIRARHARHLHLAENTFRHAGAHAIQFFADVDDSEIEGNRILDVSANGIEIDAHALRLPAPDQQSSNVAIWNNEITRCGQDYTNGGGILAHNVTDLKIHHNHVHHMPYSGIQVGNQPPKTEKGFEFIGCENNSIRFNHVHHCNQLHDDGGCIYTLGGIQRGTVIEGNFLHDTFLSKITGRYPVSMIYLDNRTSEVLVANNVVKDGAAEERNGSGGNTFRNNVQSSQEIESKAGPKPGYSPRK